MYRYIMVPLDDSVLAEGLTRHALAFAKSIGARVTFLCVSEDYGATDEGALQRTLSPELFEMQAMQRANAVLARAEAAANTESVVCDCVARIGDHPFEVIVQLATEFGCDLIVIASHGRRGVKRLMIGSQTQKVLDHASIPVLVVSVESRH